MEGRFSVLMELVVAEDKIKGEINPNVNIKEGIQDMYKILYSLNNRVMRSSTWNEMMQNLKSLENGDISPKDITVENLMQEIIRSI